MSNSPPSRSSGRSSKAPPRAENPPCAEASVTPPDPEEEAALEILLQDDSPERWHEAIAEAVRQDPRLSESRLREILDADDRIGGALSQCLGAPGPEFALDPGQRVGEYELKRELGRGGAGVVWKARDSIARRDVAVKFLQPQYVDSELRRIRFYKEIEAAANLAHESIARVFHAGEHSGIPYLVMEFVDGLDLASILAATGGEHDEKWSRIEAAALRRIEEMGGRPGTLGIDTRQAACVLWAADVASALAAAHEAGFLHRDVKPGNVMIGTDGRARLTDFGLARSFGDDSDLTKGDWVGTPDYVAPEQRWKPAETTPAADVFGLAATLWHALAGAPPHGHEGPPSRWPPPPSLRRWNHRISRNLDAVVRRALDPEPDRRHPSAGAFATDLLAVLKKEFIWARPPTLLERSVRLLSRHRRTASLLAGMGLIALAALATQEFRARSRLDTLLDRGAEATVAYGRALQAGDSWMADVSYAMALSSLDAVLLDAGHRDSAERALVAKGRLFESGLEFDLARDAYAAARNAAGDQALTRLREHRLDLATLIASGNADVPTTVRHADVYDWLLRARALPFDPTAGADLQDPIVADCLDAAGRPGRDGRDELLFVARDGVISAWTGPGGGIVPLTNSSARLSCGASNVSLKPSEPCRVSFAVEPLMTGRASAPRIAVIHDHAVWLLTPGTDSYTLMKIADVRALAGNDVKPNEVHAWVGHLAWAEGAPASPWLACATRGWLGTKALGDSNDRTDFTVRLTGADAGLVEVIPGTTEQVSTCALAWRENGRDHLVTGSEVSGYGFSHDVREGPGGWASQRRLVLGRIKGLSRLSSSWFLFSKSSEFPGRGTRYFDPTTPGGAPPGHYVLRLEESGAGFAVAAARSDLRLPEGWDPQSLACVHPDPDAAFVLGTALAGESRVLLAWQTAADDPDLSEDREVFELAEDVHFHPSSAGQMDDDPEEEAFIMIAGRWYLCGA